MTEGPDAATPVAVALLCMVGGSVQDAAHVAGALGAHRRNQRLMGAGVPASIEALEALFAAIALGPRRVIAGHDGSKVGLLAERRDGIPHEDEPLPDLLSREQAARRLRCSVSTLKRRERTGDLCPVRHGRLVRHRLVDLDRFIAEH